MQMQMFIQTRNELETLGLPRGDCAPLPCSSKRFDDGSDFKIEIPTVNSVEVFRTVLDESNKIGIRINRVTETLGIFRHRKSEIQDMINICGTL